ncbi:MAG: ABC transporter [Candidatus Altiarchaeales archaeon]|nr:ABC transporter [Candidatus Altiarchaeales archaeon]
MNTFTRAVVIPSAGFILLWLIFLTLCFIFCPGIIGLYQWRIALLDRWDLCEKTDEFVESLDTTYEHYGVRNAQDHEVITEYGTYRIMPFGRLINVKILASDNDREAYVFLEQYLSSHYAQDKRVRDVYICGGGTVMVDCR